MLAQGFTRNTFICGEGCALRAGRRRWPDFLLPAEQRRQRAFPLHAAQPARAGLRPRSTTASPRALRLLFATPRRWLEDGKKIAVERAPTAFGPVSVSIQSHLSRGEVIADVALPEREMPKRTLLRARVPEGWRVRGAKAGDRAMRVDERGTVDLTGLSGRVVIRFEVVKQ